MSKLCEYREKLNLIQDELAEKAGLSMRTILGILSGVKPRGYTLRVLSYALGITQNGMELWQKIIPEYFGETGNEIVRRNLE
ncbi:Helix-turn-helix [Arenibacter palladensis]|uniref:Helix-turn-helix n=1 Tax=Arenibacter palladensis TaxID=237373 RepID=A0A1M4T0P7_9FLAO|nr:helix-turn-helix transcriptional regulator [Arenibacter palladensis]SHE38033.1 Helix-turn-helix [Arenibacter palladensis]